MLTDAVPADAMSDAGTCAVSCPALTKVVVRLLPFQVTCVPETKLAPLIVRVKAAPPARAKSGDKLVNVAAGLMVKVTAGGETCSGEDTVTAAVPAEAISEAGTAAVTCPALTNVVVRALPFQVTAVVAVNPAPLTVNVNPGPPATALVGEMFEIDKAVVMVNVSGEG